MGVNLRDIVTQEEMRMEDLSGRTIAVDGLNIIYQFLSIIRDRMTGEPLKDSRGRITSHLSGIFYRTTRMIQNGITPVFIFDGRPPDFKKGTRMERRRLKDEARKKLERAVSEGDRKKIRLYSQQVSEVTGDMLDESRKLLDAMGVQHVTAPSEGEAQAARMCSRGTVYASASQDWDSLLFGAERLVRNLAITGKRKLPGRESYVKVKPEIITLSGILSELSLTREQLVIVGILVGTDYNPGGIKGIGPKKALDLVRERKSLDSVMKEIEWTFDTDPREILEFFMNPPSIDVTLSGGRPDGEMLRKILVDDHDFSEERLSKTLENLLKAEETKKQSNLQKFF